MPGQHAARNIFPPVNQRCGRSFWHVKEVVITIDAIPDASLVMRVGLSFPQKSDPVPIDQGVAFHIETRK